MNNFINTSQFTQEDITKFRESRQDKRKQIAQKARNYHKEKLKHRAEEAQYHPGIQVGFGKTVTHTFLGDAEDTGSNLDYNA